MPTRALLQRAGKDPRFQKDLSRLMDDVGMTAQTAEIIRLLSEAPADAVQEIDFEVGRTMEWMGLWDNRQRPARPGRVQMIRWGGRRSFKAWEFKIKDGVKTYTFVLPKECGNLALASVTEEPMPACPMVTGQASCDQSSYTKTVGFSVSSTTGIDRVEVSRAGSAVTVLRRDNNFTVRGLAQPAGSYTVRAWDTFGRELQQCASVNVADVPCERPAPKPTPAAACTLTATATQQGSEWAIALDGSGSQRGDNPAQSMKVTVVDGSGQAALVTYQGKPVSDFSLTPPFSANVTVRPRAAGTYTYRFQAATTGQAGMPGGTCSADVTVVKPESGVDFFVDGTFGKQRRQYELQSSPTLSAADIQPGFCDPQLIVKAGPLFWFAEGKGSFAPSLGLAFQFGSLDDNLDFDPNDYNNVSFLGEAVVNYHFKPHGAFIGSGLGWWDIFDGDHDTAAWIVNFGVPLKDTDKGIVLFIGEGRLFFSGEEQDSNYNFGAGVRYIFK
jgi:hypothetical protein